VTLSRIAIPIPEVGIPANVLDPSGDFTRLAGQVKTLMADYEPHLDRAVQTCPTPDRRQIKDLLLRHILDSRRKHDKDLLAMAQALQLFGVPSALHRIQAVAKLL
jgi:hypothetical protein